MAGLSAVYLAQMISLTVPPRFVAAVKPLHDAFVEEATKQGLQAEVAEEIFALVPEALRRAPSFLDRMGGMWRYDYGRPIKGLPGGGAVIGTHMWPEVEHFVRAARFARERLGSVGLQSFLTRLGDRSRHSDYLTEFAPVIRAAMDCTVQYEVSLGSGKQTVDWLIRGHHDSIALEVKNRLRDLVDSMGRIEAGDTDPDGTAPAPTHDPNPLLSDIVTKFSPRDPSELIQAGWIHTEIRQEEDELRSAFENLDHSRVHVLLFGDWDEDVYLLTSDAEVRSRTLALLNARQSRRFVFRRGEPNAS